MSSVLKNGSSGGEVTSLQQNLVQLGFAIEADGKFGPKTEHAVKELQTAFGYTVDGKVGDGTQFLIKQQLGLNWNYATWKATQPR